VVESQYPCDAVVPIEQEPHHHLVIANNFVRAFVVEIAPHERTLCHHHSHDYVMYVIGDAEIVSAPRDSAPKTHNYRAGDCEFSPAGSVHVVENRSDTNFSNLLVELLPGLRDLRRGADPRIVAGNATVEALFKEERISVWSLETEADARAEIHFPAIFVTLNPDSVRDVSWFPSGRSLLGCDEFGTPLRAILFQLGRTEVQPDAVRKRTGEPIKTLRAHADEPE
jgi:hypothetical protein